MTCNELLRFAKLKKEGELNTLKENFRKDVFDIIREICTILEGKEKQINPENIAKELAEYLLYFVRYADSIEDVCLCGNIKEILDIENSNIQNFAYVA